MSVSYRYFWWHITDIKDITDEDNFCCQVAQLIYFRDDGNKDWNDGFVVATSPNGIWADDEGPNNILDYDLSTKFCDQNFRNNGVTDIYIDNKIPFEFDSYSYGTANDAPERDPRTWKLYGSNDGITYDLISEVTDFIATDNREQFVSPNFSVELVPNGLLESETNFSFDFSATLSSKKRFLKFKIQTSVDEPFKTSIKTSNTSTLTVNSSIPIKVTSSTNYTKVYI